MTLSQIYAKPLGDRPGFKLEKCTNDVTDLPNISGFSALEVQLICGAFSQPGSAEYVLSSIKEQRLVFGIGAAFSFIYFIPLLMLTKRLSKAKAMYRRLTHKGKLDLSGDS